MALFLVFIAPFLSAGLSYLVATSVPMLGTIALVSTGVQLASVMFIAGAIRPEQGYVLTNYFAVNHMGAIILFLLACGGVAASAYARGYLTVELSKGVIGFSRAKKLFTQLHLFLLAMSVAITTTNPILTWIAIEATTLTTAFLISFYNKPSAMEAAWKYLMLNSVGLLFAFFGTLLYLTPTLTTHLGVTTWQTLLAAHGSYNPFIIKMAFLFALIGYGTKVGLVPMHTWLPDAHSKAPSPISSLLSGVLLNVPLLAILRLKTITDAAVGADFSSKLLIAFGITSLVVSSAIIFIQKNYKRLLAYSSIEHMGIITLGFGIGGPATYAAILHMIYHSLTKSLLFFSAGNIFLKYSSTKIANIRGLVRTLPLTAVVFFIGILAIIGMPPWGIFFTEMAIVSAGMARHLAVSITAIIALVIVGVGFIRHLVSMEFGHPDESIHPGEMNGWTITPIIVLALTITLISIVMPQSIQTFLRIAASHI